MSVAILTAVSSAQAQNLIWDVNTLAWIPWDGAVTGGGGGTTVDQGVGGASAWLVTGPLTDMQLRASAVPVSGAFYPATQPVSAVSLPLPSGAAIEAGNLATIAATDFATEATLALIKAKTDNLDAASSTLATASAQSAGNASLAALAALPIAQGATIAGQVGPLLQGAVSDAVSALSVDTVAPISLTSDGRVRVITFDESFNFTPWGGPYEYGSESAETGGFSAW